MSNYPKVIFVCNGKSCSKDGAINILNELKKNANQKIEIKTKFCFGKCGNGPIIVVLPNETWYEKVLPEQINLILAKQ
jgi:NADH:ubiquinone oxidoreductase subunit E